MALHFQQLTISDIRKETSDCVSISFSIPQELKTEFSFIQGQSVTIKTSIDEVRRSYSICSSPIEQELRIAVKKMNGGNFSTYANDTLKVGDTLDVMAPTGSFYTVLNPHNTKNYAFFAAGSGITPILSIIKTILYTEPKSSIVLVYGNKTEDSIIFKNELETLKNNNAERFTISHILSRNENAGSLYGRIDRKRCADLSNFVNYSSIDEFFLCGPEDMIFAVREYLNERGIDSGKVHFELFTTPTREHTQIYTSTAPTNEEGSAISIKLDGLEYNFFLEYNGNTILDAALEAGADAPFACKGGICTTCKAKLIEGEVEMESNYGLGKSEIKAGYILTCQSHPKTKKVVVDYDQA